MLCEYGCGKPELYQLKNKRWCCSKSQNSCSEVKEKTKKTFLKKYGVDHPSKIEEVKEKMKQTWIEKYGVDNPSKSKEIKEKYKQTCLKKYGVDNPSKLKEVQEKIEKTLLKNYGVDHPLKSKEVKEKVKQTWIEKYGIDHPNKLTISKIKKRYSFFYKIEKPQYNPDKPEEKEIQVHCKYNECKNSKENGGWFTPKVEQLKERIRQLEHPEGNGGAYLYCSEKCKSKCDLYNLRFDPYKDKDFLYTSKEYKTFKQEVLRIQLAEDGYNFCEYCYNKKDLHIHHELPQKTHPELALDPDNGIVCCEKCHYRYGHQTGTECSTGNLANN